MARQIICISHAPGAGGREVGRAVAERLGYRCVDDEVIAEAADRAALDPAVVADAERRKPLVERLVGGMAAAGEYLPPPEWAMAAPPDADLRALITDALGSIADRGSVVIVSHAASFALAGRDVLRVLVTAPPGTRARRVSGATGTDERDAARQVTKEDGARADYLRRFYGIDHELPTHYDLVVNTDALTQDAAAAIIEAAAASPSEGAG